MTEQMLLHEPAVGAGILGPQADELVEIEGGHLRPVRLRETRQRATSSSYSAIGVRPVARPNTRSGLSCSADGQPRRDDPGGGLRVRETP